MLDVGCWMLGYLFIANNTIRGETADCSVLLAGGGG